MLQILDIAFVRICVMRRNYNGKFNELTPMGWETEEGRKKLESMGIKRENALMF